MATEYIRIIITESGSRNVTSSIRTLGEAINKVNSPVNFLRNSLIALGAIKFAEKVFGFANELQTLRNRLVLVTKSAEDTNAVFEELKNISDESRSSVFATANVYARFSLATRELAISQKEVLDLVQSLNEAVILSGANAREAEAGLLQFSQGLASGRLAGDELRAVLEQLPIIADVIGKQLGVTRGALRFLASEGKITPEVIVEAFRKAGKELHDNFGKTIPTISQAMLVLHNAIVGLLDRIDKSSGVLQLFSQAILFIAKNIEFFTRVLIFGGSLLAILALTAAVASLAGALFSLTNPLGIVIGAIGLIGAAFAGAGAAAAAFADKIQIEFGWVTLAQYAQAVIEELGQTVKTLIGYVNESLPKALQNLVQNNFVTFISRLSKFLDPIIRTVILFFETLRENLDNLPVLITAALKTLLNNIGSILHQILAFVVRQTVAIIGEVLNEIVSGLKDGFIKDLFSQLGEAITGIQDKGNKGFLPRTTEETLALIKFLETAQEINKTLSNTPVSDFFSRVNKRLVDIAKLNKEVKDSTGNLNEPGAAPTGLKSLSQVLIESEIEKLTALRGELQLTNKERKTQLDLQKELLKIQNQVPEGQFSEESRRTIELLVRARVAYQDVTNSLDRYSEALPKTARGLSILAETTKEAASQVDFYLGLFDDGALSAESFNLLIDQLNQLIETQADVYNQVFGPADKYRVQLVALSKISEQVTDDTDRLKIKLYKSKAAYDSLVGDPTPTAGLKRGIETIRQELEDTGSVIEKTFVSSWDGATDALTDFIVTGKNGFRDLLESISKDLVKLGLQLFILKPLFEAVFGNQPGQIGGLLGGLSGLFGGFGGARAGGGDVRPGRTYLVGEDGPELLNLGTGGGGTIIPNSEIGSAGSPVVNINVYTKDADSFRKSGGQIKREFQTALRRGN